MNEDLQAIYGQRFAGAEVHRDIVWRILANYFQRWIRPTDSVLDLGAGFCEFINNIRAEKKFALDLNPATPHKAAPGVNVLSQDVTQRWLLPDNCIDAVFTSNCFEHLPNKEALRHCFEEACRVLRPGGLLITMGPNIRFCFNVYWDFVDHFLPLSDRSMVEAGQIAGFTPEKVVPRFLPYTMVGRKPSSFLIRLYLRMPVVWPIFGKQFLVFFRKAN